MAIGIAMAYRTVPTTAIKLIAGQIPTDLAIEERTMIYERGAGSRAEAKRMLFTKWQRRWDEYEGWTKVFVKDLEKWVSRKFRGLNYCITQALTGHGVFGSYLKRIGKQETERERAQERLGGITAENIAECLQKNEVSWRAVTDMLRGIIGKKGKDERERQNRARAEKNMIGA
ncbi:uncharacterized protein [Euwallacea fornicatus]|uniref:uncharacterized protein n=1 Tax=Euwallacea fornicatus TaxID=995702 RepID=UPI00338E1982